MKKLVFAVLTIGVMAACTKSNVRFEQPGEISFQPVAQKATKAAVDGTVYPTTENFKVWAWWDDAVASEAPAYGAYQTAYIAQGEFTARDNFNWGGVTPYYWPTLGSLIFAGYSPAGATAESFVYAPGTQTFTVTDYVQSNEISSTKDLMWFDVDKSYLNNPGTTEVKGVLVVFKHALSWLTFNFVLDKAIDNHTWEITGVTLKNVNTKGNFSATPDILKWTLSEQTDDKKDMTVYTGAHPVSTTVTRLENTENGVVVIPQPCMELFVQYNLTASTGQKIPQNVPLDLAKGIAGGEWLPGKHYVYTITFGANEIMVAPTVNDWADEVVPNIPVQ